MILCAIRVVLKNGDCLEQSWQSSAKKFDSQRINQIFDRVYAYREMIERKRNLPDDYCCQDVQLIFNRNVFSESKLLFHYNRELYYEKLFNEMFGKG